MKISGNIVDLIQKRIYSGTVHVDRGIIRDISQEPGYYTNFILPGFVDSHIHLESSMLVPSEFARLAAIHGTVATVSDPHEIANVLGQKGIDFMITNGQSVPFKFFFGAPSCVPASSFDVSGGNLDAQDVRRLLERPEIKYLGEMMNVSGVLHNDREVLSKIEAAKEYGKPIDGHAPGLTGEELRYYVDQGISTDHESFSRSEALEKLSLGMKILIREGSVAKNLNTLAPLIDSHPDMCMFCTDDLHPDDLLQNQIFTLVKGAVARGMDLFNILRCASLNPVRHYGLDVGLLQKGDSADFIVVDNLHDFSILETYVSGRLVARHGDSFIDRSSVETPNTFHARRCRPEDLRVPYPGGYLNVIDALDGEIVTEATIMTPQVQGKEAVADPARDLLKLVLVSRYRKTAPAVAFVHNFGLREGAIASSVSHDSHNIIAVGANDMDLSKAINALIDAKGGLSVAHEGRVHLLPLPVAGIMSDSNGASVARDYASFTRIAKDMGSSLHAPFMTLSFMALLVIPHRKIGVRGLFDGDQFRYSDLFSSPLE